MHSTRRAAFWWALSFLLFWFSFFYMLLLKSKNATIWWETRCCFEFLIRGIIRDNKGGRVYFLKFQGPFVAVDKLVKIIAEKCPQSFDMMLERMAGKWDKRRYGGNGDSWHAIFHRIGARGTLITAAQYNPHIHHRHLYFWILLPMFFQVFKEQTGISTMIIQNWNRSTQTDIIHLILKWLSN